MKAKSASEAKKLEDIPNIGPRIANDLRLLGIGTPQKLSGKDPVKLYRDLNRKTGQRHDPCVLDTFMAAVDFMNGGKPMPWWSFTEQRKKISKQKSP